jgi:hypothetical protein
MNEPMDTHFERVREKISKSWQSAVRPFFWGGGEWGSAARRTAILISFATNLVLIIALGIAAQQIFTIKNFVNNNLIKGFYENFIYMDLAHITTTVQVSDTIQVVDAIPVVFDLELSQNTEVVLTQDTPIKNATIYLNNQPVPLDLILRAGTPLNIHLELTVPVSKTVPLRLTVPVQLEIPVDIPLEDTMLHDPFIGLQEVLSPYYWNLKKVKDSWHDYPLCQGAIMQTFCSRVLLAK